MKQGRATSSSMGSTKVEPNSRGVSVDAVADIGVQHIDLRPEPLYEGRGLEAPKAKTTIHHCGSQGKH